MTVTWRGTRFGAASGVAPAAFLAVYKAMWLRSFLFEGEPVGLFSDIFAAVDRAVADGCDVISLSLGAQQYGSYFDDIRYLNAAKVV